MKRMNLSMLACMLATALMSLLLTTPVAQAASAVTCPGWNLIASPNAGSYDYLSGVVAVSASDVWAVGNFYTSNSPYHQTLIEHWNGSSWSLVSSPNPGDQDYLYGVAAVSATDVWAVGYSWNSSNDSTQTLIEHWNGSSWSLVPSPNPGPDNYLYGVAAVSATDVWAVGDSDSNSSPFPTLIEHWNGSSWSVVSSPNPGLDENALYSVTAVSASDVWAVGNSFSYATGRQTLIEHWDGTSWKVVSSPNPGSGQNSLSGVTAFSASNIWAVGSSRTGSNPYQTLIEHWNGSNWNIVPSPNPGSNNNYLYSVAAVSATNVWAVGTDSGHTLIEHWNGTSWSVAKGATVGKGRKALNGVAQVPGTRQLWAVGDWTSQTLTEFHC